MESKKSELLQVRLSKSEKEVIKEKADLLGISISEYVLQCCIFSNVTAMFMDKLHKKYC